MATKLIAGSQRKTISVLEAVSTHKDVIVHGFEQAQNDLLGTRHGPPLDIGPLFDRVVDMLAESAANVVSSDQTLELGRDSGENTMTQREGTTRALRKELRAVHHAVQSRFGENVAINLGLYTPWPQDAVELVSRANTVLAALRSTTPLPSPTDGSTLTMTQVMEALPARTAAVESVIASRANERRNGSVAKNARDAKVAHWNAVYYGTISLLESMLRFAGKPELAAQVRPPQRRARKAKTAAPKPAPDAPVNKPA